MASTEINRRQERVIGIYERGNKLMGYREGEWKSMGSMAKGVRFLRQKEKGTTIGEGSHEKAWPQRNFVWKCYIIFNSPSLNFIEVSE